MIENCNFLNGNVLSKVLKSFVFVVISLMSGHLIGQYDSTNVFIEILVEKQMGTPMDIPMGDDFDLEESSDLAFSSYEVELSLEDDDNISSIHVSLFDNTTDSLITQHVFQLNGETIDLDLWYKHFDDVFIFGMGTYTSCQIIKCEVSIEKNGVFSPVIRQVVDLDEN